MYVCLRKLKINPLMNIKETACILSLLSHSSVQISQTGVYTAHGMNVKCHRVGDAYGPGVRDGEKEGWVMACYKAA